MKKSVPLTDSEILSVMTLEIEEEEKEEEEDKLNTGPNNIC